MPEMVQDLKAKWLRLIRESKFRGNLEAFSTSMGQSNGYVRGLLKNSSWPSAQIIMRMCEALEVTPNDLLSVNGNHWDLEGNQATADSLAQEIWQITLKNLSRSREQVTGRDIMVWWYANSGRFEGADKFADRIDLYKPPCNNDRTVHALNMGSNSLATLSLGVGSPELLRRTIAPLGPDFANRILVAHDEALEQGPVTTIERLNVAHPERGIQIQMEYMRTLLPVSISGSFAVLCYAELLGRAGIVGGDLFQISSA